MKYGNTQNHLNFLPTILRTNKNYNFIYIWYIIYYQKSNRTYIFFYVNVVKYNLLFNNIKLMP